MANGHTNNYIKKQTSTMSLFVQHDGEVDSLPSHSSRLPGAILSSGYRLCVRSFACGFPLGSVVLFNLPRACRQVDWLH